LREIAENLNWELHYCAKYFRDCAIAGVMAWQMPTIDPQRIACSIAPTNLAPKQSNEDAGGYERENEPLLSLDAPSSSKRKAFPLFSWLSSNCKRFLNSDVSNTAVNSMTKPKSSSTLWFKASKSRWKAVAAASALAILAPLGLTQSEQLQRLSSTAVSLPPGETQKITVLADTWSGYSTVRNPEFQQELKKQGIEIAYENEFNQVERARRLSAGDADLILTTVDQFVRTQPQGAIVGLIDRSHAADALVLNTKRYSHLRSVDDLGALADRQQGGRQKAIAFAKASPSEYLGLLPLFCYYRESIIGKET